MRALEEGERRVSSDSVAPNLFSKGTGSKEVVLYTHWWRDTHWWWERLEGWRDWKGGKGLCHPYSCCTCNGIVLSVGRVYWSSGISMELM